MKTIEEEVVAGVGAPTTLESLENTVKFKKRLEKLTSKKKFDHAFLSCLKQNATVIQGEVGSEIWSSSVDHVHKASECGTHLWFARHLETNERKLHKYHTCQRTYLCSFCDYLRSCRLSGKLHEQLEVLLDKHEAEPWMLTLTVKNSEDLKERLDHINSSFNRLRERWKKDRQRGTTSTQLSKSLGAVAFLEIKRGKGGHGWHPHYHIILLVPKGKRLLKKRTSDEWLSVTDDSFITDVRKMAFGTEIEKVQAICEVSKYATKHADLTPSDRLLSNYYMYRRRAIRKLGCFSNLVIVPDQKPEKLTDLECKYIFELWRFQGGKYQKAFVSPLNPKTLSADIPTAPAPFATGKTRFTKVVMVNPHTGEPIKCRYTQ